MKIFADDIPLIEVCADSGHFYPTKGLLTSLASTTTTWESYLGYL